MPRSANFTLREFGIVLFLACVGLKAGDGFLKTLTDGPGFYWMAMASLITLIPLVTVALFARAVLKLNYVTLCGILAGSMTDPPALAFANTMVGKETPSVAYATVYPLTMILRVVFAQTLVLMFMT
jgi:putative transport protein